MTKFNRTSLIDVCTDIYNEDVRPVDPVIVYNSTTGCFSIQSACNPMYDHEQIIHYGTDIPGMDFSDSTIPELENFITTMTNKDIRNMFGIAV